MECVRVKHEIASPWLLLLLEHYKVSCNSAAIAAQTGVKHDVIQQ
jgi:hypothetical protein